MLIIYSVTGWMARLFVQYLAIYSVEKLPNIIKISPKKFKILPNIKETLKKVQNI